MISKNKGLHGWGIPIAVWYNIGWKPRVGFLITSTYFSLCLLFISFGISYEPARRKDCYKRRLL